MPRSRNSRNNRVDTLPADWWEREPKVYLYRVDPRRVWQYLGVFLADYFDEGFVASRFGGATSGTKLSIKAKLGAQKCSRLRDHLSPFLVRP